jgi:hypothetical protein
MTLAMSVMQDSCFGKREARKQEDKQVRFGQTGGKKTRTRFVPHKRLHVCLVQTLKCGSVYTEDNSINEEQKFR